MESNIDIILNAYDKGLKASLTEAKKEFKDFSTTIKSAITDANTALTDVPTAVEETFQSVSKEAENSSETIKKLNKENEDSYAASIEKIKQKLIELGDTALKVAEIMATTLYAFTMGNEVGGPWAGILSGAVAMGSELYSVMSATNAQAADLDDKYLKIYENRKVMSLLGITEQGIYKEINDLVGDQLSLWAKIKEDLPDTIQELVRQDERDIETIKSIFGGGGSAIKTVGRIAFPDIMTAFSSEGINAQIDDVISSIKRPENEVSQFFESTTEKQKKELALELVNYRDHVNAIAESQAEKHNLMATALIQYFLKSKQILADGASQELSVFQKLADDVSTSITAAYDPKIYDAIVVMMKEKFSVIQDAEETSDTIILKNKEVAHDLRLQREKEFGEKLAQQARENQAKYEAAQTDFWILKAQDQENNAFDVVQNFQKKLTSFSETGRAERIAQIKRERDDTIAAYKQLGMDSTVVMQAFNERLAAENKKGGTDNSGQVASTIASITEKLDALNGDTYKLAIDRINQEFNSMAAVVGKTNEQLVRWYNLAIGQAGAASVGEVINNDALTKALEKLDDAYAKATLSKEEYAKYQVDKEFERERIAALAFGPAAQDYVKNAQMVSDAKKTLIDKQKAEQDAKDAENLAIQQNNALRSIYKDLGNEGIKGLFDAEVQLLDDRYKQYDKFIQNKYVLDKWYANEYQKLLDKKALAENDFYAGWSVAYRKLQEDGAKLGQAGYDTFNKLTSDIKNGLTNFTDDFIEGKFKTAGEYLQSFSKSVLKTWFDMINQMIAKWLMLWSLQGISSMFGGLFGSATSMTGMNLVNPSGAAIGFAEGGPIPGTSPSPSADNLLIRATAGEWVHPVSSVEYYGSGIMEAIRRRMIPKSFFDGFSFSGLSPYRPAYAFAAGGQVSQGAGYSISVPISISGASDTKSLSKTLPAEIEKTVIRVMREQLR